MSFGVQFSDRANKDFHQTMMLSLPLKQWGGITDKLEGGPEVGVNAIKLSIGARTC